MSGWKPGQVAMVTHQDERRRAELTSIAVAKAHRSLDGWGGLRIAIWVADLKLLLDRIAELEGDTAECRFCLGPLSLTGNAGEGPWACEDDRGLHCGGCADRCPACKYEGQDRTSLSPMEMLG